MQRLYQINVPGDNSCFFHAVGLHVNMHAFDLRKLCSQLMFQYQNMDFNGMTLEDWIQASENCSAIQYSKKLLFKHFWGGALEMMVLAHYFQRPIVVYQEQKITKVANKITIFREDLQDKEPIYLLYINNNHYACLKKNKT